MWQSRQTGGVDGENQIRHFLLLRKTIESPYQSPQHYDRPLEAQLQVKSYSVMNSVLIFLRWLIVCALAAAPSFVLGLMLEGVYRGAIIGMICGVLCYVLAYTAIEHTPFFRQLLTNRAVRRTAQIGYGTRIGLSIIFPIGFYLDMFVGFLSVPVSGWILTTAGRQNIMGEAGTQGDFISHFVMTVTQGAFLNIILLGYMLIVYSIVRAVMGPSTVAATKD